VSTHTDIRSEFFERRRWVPAHRADSVERRPVSRHSEVNQMHMVIYALVEAPTQHDALVEGKSVFDRLVGANPHGCAVFEQKRSASQGGDPAVFR